MTALNAMFEKDLAGAGFLPVKCQPLNSTTAHAEKKMAKIFSKGMTSGWKSGSTRSRG
jgi:hypothetical protein